jgi:hypothetical protein
MVAPDLQKQPIEKVAELARPFAHGEYAAALEKGDHISSDNKQKVVQESSMSNTNYKH